MFHCTGFRMIVTRKNLLWSTPSSILQTAAKDQDIIDVGETVGEVSKDRIHHPLEGVPRVPEAEGKTQEHKHPKRSDDGEEENQGHSSRSKGTQVYSTSHSIPPDKSMKTKSPTLYWSLVIAPSRSSMLHTADWTYWQEPNAQAFTPFSSVTSRSVPPWNANGLCCSISFRRTLSAFRIRGVTDNL